MAKKRKLKLAVFKFSSCDGCQLSLLDCEDELLEVAHAVDIAYFLEATTAHKAGPYDLSLVEGSVATEHDIKRLEHIRKRSRILVALGACATSGGIQALRNLADLSEYTSEVYPHPDYISSLPDSSPLSEYVMVDAELRGCPVSKTQLLEAVAALVQGRQPFLPTGAVCLQCKQAGITCLMAAGGAPCMGPVTQAGCGALCPSFGRPCYGCFGPKEAANPDALSAWFKNRLGLTDAQVYRRFNQINSHAWRAEEKGQS